ncbi:MAG: tetratricopeptide repeat protein [Nitrospira sp.]|nr:tetratricopeptide repeat protein [Nitrospira sp.]
MGGQPILIACCLILPWFMGGPSPTWAVSAGQVTPIASNGTLSGHELLRIGEIHDLQQHFRETLTYYQLALSRFREKQQPQGIATALLKIARVYERQGKIQAAYKALQEAIPLFARSADRSAQGEALLAMGRITARLGRRDESRDSFSQAVGLFTRGKDARGWNEATVQLGLLQVSDEESAAGLSALQQAIEEAGTRRDAEQQLTALLALGDAHRLLDRTLDARADYLRGLRLAEADHQLPFEATLRLRLAQLDEADGALNDGVTLAKRAVLLSQTLHDAATEAQAWSLLADLYRKLDQPTESEAAEMRALALYRKREIFVHGARQEGS